MATATITSKGQITIPKEIRAALNLDTGDRINFVLDAYGKVAFIPATKDVRGLKGCVPKPAVPVSLEDMEATIRTRGGKP